MRYEPDEDAGVDRNEDAVETVKIDRPSAEQPLRRTAAKHHEQILQRQKNKEHPEQGAMITATCRASS